MRQRKPRQSKVAIRFLEDIQRKFDLPYIYHAKNGGEVEINYFKVDGFIKELNLILEFHGSCWHGNISVYKDKDRCNPRNRKVTARYLYNKTLAREKTLCDLGFNVAVIWDYQYKNKKLFNKWCDQFRQYIKSSNKFYLSSTEELPILRKKPSADLNFKSILEF